MPDLARLASPAPTTIPIDVAGETIQVTYDRNAFTVGLIERTFLTPIIDRLCAVLLDWDVTDGGAPLTPTALAPAEAEDAAPPLSERWRGILLRFPREVLKQVDGGILDDFLGASWRGAAYVAGSAPAASTATAPTGTI